MPERVQFTVNGALVVVEAEPDERLVDTLREKFGLTGTKVGCRIGECGACSVLLDDEVVPACLMLTWQADGRRVTTIEGLTPAEGLSDLQRAFVEAGAVQCGFCTPGMVIAGEALLRHLDRPTSEQIRSGIAGNLCRCTGYTKIVAAIERTGRRRTRLRR